MSEFKIVTILNKDLFKTKLTKEIEYFDRDSNFKDTVTFDNKKNYFIRIAITTNYK